MSIVWTKFSVASRLPTVWVAVAFSRSTTIIGNWMSLFTRKPTRWVAHRGVGAHITLRNETEIVGCYAVLESWRWPQLLRNYNYFAITIKCGTRPFNCFIIKTTRLLIAMRITPVICLTKTKLLLSCSLRRVLSIQTVASGRANTRR